MLRKTFATQSRGSRRRRLEVPLRYARGSQCNLEDFATQSRGSRHRRLEVPLCYATRLPRNPEDLAAGGWRFATQHRGSRHRRLEVLLCKTFATQSRGSRHRRLEISGNAGLFTTITIPKYSIPCSNVLLKCPITKVFPSLPLLSYFT